MKAAVLSFVMLLTASAVHAQVHAPTRQQWADAERVLRAHYTAAGATVLEVRVDPRHSLGTTFWARFADRGLLVAVRGAQVIEVHGEPGVTAVLRADDALHAHAWAAADLLYLLTTAGVPPPLPRNALSGPDVAAVLRPSIEYGRAGATMVVYCFDQGPPEAPANRSYYVQRATGTLDAEGHIAWTVARVILDMSGHERLLPQTPRPTLYDACSLCVARGASCAACTSRTCRTCLEHAEVLTDPSFCLPRCR